MSSRSENLSGQLGSLHSIVAIIIAVGLVATIGFVFWQNIINKNTTTEVADYAQCIKSEKSVVQQTYPEVCVTKDGKSFTNPDQKVDTKKAATMKDFCTPKEKICFSYPADWSVKPQSLTQQDDGVEEAFVVADNKGASWLQLKTGMSGIGGACGNEDGSYTKVLKTHTTNIAGSYLLNSASAPYYDTTVYAVGVISYDASGKKWTTNMMLNTSKASHSIGKIDVCDLGLAVFNGKNTKIDASSDSVGAISFEYYPGDTTPTYASETEATAALSSDNAEKAYAILQSAYYK